MTQSYWPFAGVKTTETQFSQYNRRMQMSGVWGNPGDQTLRINAGVGFGLVLTPGYAFIRGHMYFSDEDVSVTVAPSDSQPRIDLVVLRLDPTANTIEPVVIKGNPAASNPSQPAPVTSDAGEYDIPIAAIAVAGGSSSINSGNITDRRIFSALQWGVWETQSRPGTVLNPGTPRTGQAGMNTQTGYPEYYNGTAWVRFIPEIVPIANGGTGATTAAAARAALGVPPISHSHSAADITTGVLNRDRVPNRLDIDEIWAPSSGILFIKGYGPDNTAAIEIDHINTNTLELNEPLTGAGKTRFLYLDSSGAGNVVRRSTATTFPPDSHNINTTHSGLLTVENGGTSASTPAQARINLGAASSTHVHDISDIYQDGSRFIDVYLPTVYQKKIPAGFAAPSGGSDGDIYLRVI